MHYLIFNFNKIKMSSISQTSVMKRIISYLPILLLLFSSETFGQTKSNLTLLDLFDLEYVSDPQISPDGSKIIYVRNFKDIMTDSDLSNLWIVNFDGSQNRPLTQGNQRDFMPRWSHDGSKIVFKSNMQDVKMKLYLLWLDTKETVALTNSAIAPGEVSWSGDDKQLAFSMFVPKENKSTLLKIPTKPEGAKWNDAPIYIDQMVYRSDGAGYLKSGNTQIFTLGIDGGKPTQLTFSELNHGNPIWSKDGKSLIFSANLHEKHELEPLNSEVYQLTLSDGKINPFTKRFGPYSNPLLSPDGSKIA